MHQTKDFTTFKITTLKKLILCAFFLISTFIGCQPDADPFLGKWVNIKNAEKIMTIDKGKNSYIIEYAGERLAAYEKDGVIHVSFWGMDLVMALDKKSSHIIFDSNEFKKITY